ncbi:MAG: hypothetical protein PHS42_05905 [Sulfurimonas sp.]|nr:hypothetical protein [Sulfurimonas sp.]
MNVLFYVEPLIELGKPYWKEGWVNEVCLDIVQTLQKSGNAYVFKLITNEAVAQRVVFRDESFELLSFTQEELLEPFGSDYMRASTSWHLGSYTQEQLLYYENIMSEKLGEFVPDVIISFTPVAFLESLFNKALVLHHEFSIFSRSPYPQSWFFDPVGVSSRSFLNRFEREIKEAEFGEKSRERVRDFKAFCKSTLLEKSPFKDALDAQREKFEYLVLLPLQFSGYYLFDDLVAFKSQYEYCVYVLDKTPHSVGVVVNMHPEYPVLEREAVEFLQSKYPHFICLESFNSIYASGQFILPLVDGVVSVSSSLVLQALLFDKKIILLGAGCFEYVADALSLEGIESTLGLKSDDKDAVLYFLLTRYAVTSEYVHNPLWLDGFLKRSLERFGESGIGADFYDLIDEESVVFEKLRLSIDKNAHNVPQYVKKATAELFFDFGLGIDGELFLSERVEDEGEQSFCFDLKNVQEIRSLRFDPLGDYCVVRLEYFKLVDANGEVDVRERVSSNACHVEDNVHYFESNDSQMFFVPEDLTIFHGVQRVEIGVFYLHRGAEALLQTLKRRFKIVLELKESLALQETKLQDMENKHLQLLQSNSMLITAPLRAIAAFFKRYIK